MNENKKAQQVNEISTECSELKFDKKLIGYDIGQVDRYIKNIAVSYQAAYEEYYVKCAEYDKLLGYYKKLEAHAQSRSGADIITGVLQSTEALMRKITADAKAEAEKIISELCEERFEAKIFAQKMIEEAREEAEAAKEKAQKIITEAYANAVKIENQAKTDLKKSNELIAQAISGMQNLILTGEADGPNAEFGGAPDDSINSQHKIIPFDASKNEGRNRQL